MVAIKSRLIGGWQYLIAVSFAALFGFPLVWTFYSSLKSSHDILRYVWALPTTLNWSGYIQVFTSSSFGSYYSNSVSMVVMTVPVLTLIGAMAAYVFARIRFRGRGALFYLFLGGIIIPVHVTLIPLFVMNRDLGLLGRLPSMALPFVGFGLPFSIFILRGFFEELPVELEEAARIDGCSTARIFWTIALPLARPALVTVMILNILAAWNEYLFALTFVSSNNKAYTLPLGILNFTTSLGSTAYDKLFAGLTVGAVPVLIIYFLAQRTIVKSLTAGAVKG